MKKYFLTTLIFAGLSVVFTGCLKDKGFENGTYGINDPDTQPPGVGFPLGVKAKNDFGLNASSSSQDVPGLVFVNLEAGKPASSDVKVTLVDSSATMIARYNAANGLSDSTAVLALPAAKWKINGLTSPTPFPLTIPAGARNVEASITVANTDGLDPNRQYAVGLQIASVDGGYTIANNLKNLFILFGIKNKYDGKYNIKFKNYHPSLNPTFQGTSINVEMHTTGPNSVKIYMPQFPGYYHPAILSGGLTAFGSQEPEFTVNPTTNAVTVQNAYVGATTFYVMMPGFDNAGYNSRWEEATKTMYACWGYNQGPGNTFVLGNSRAWIDTLTRTGPR